MEKTVLLFESRELCYESNRYFVACLKDAFESFGYPVEVCDLSERMEMKLESILERQENYLFAIDFNSLLPRLELEDGQPYLEALQIPFYDYLVDHPLYHHLGLIRIPAKHSVICIDTCHLDYIRQYYPSVTNSFCLPLGAMQAEFERSFSQKRLELLFLGTYDSEKDFYQEEFAIRLNHDYLADFYLRNKNRKETVLAAAESKIPFTIIGHGWKEVKGLDKKHVQIYA